MAYRARLWLFSTLRAMTPHLQRETLRHAALEMGFDACGFARAVPVQQWAVEQYDRWIADGCNDCMEYANIAKCVTTRAF